MKKSGLRRNLCGQVVHDLGQRILAGQWEPGTALPQEVSLCESMGVSRTVIREAIKSLAAKGLVESKAKRGTIVQPPNCWNYLDPEVLAWQTRADGDGKLLSYLTEFRQTIEPAAASFAATRGSDEHLDHIKEAFEQMERSTEDVEAFLAADTEFHTSILRATGNPFFAPVANLISVALQGSLRVTNRQPSDNRVSIPVHEKVMKAIIERKPRAARAAMKAHLDEAAERIAASTEQP
ncbi:FadR/GntR family transcriptional regulator [Novipirellula caenicola]|uniref:HTH-type transcriptional regulator LutR n=1 Tax=Novipirellula caenicola TaxID=1536901 RepID=A0ABP9W0C8_9BACT